MVTPVPIPNTEVKPRRADDTARVTVWERRSSPGLHYKDRKPLRAIEAAFLFCPVAIPFQKVAAETGVLVCPRPSQNKASSNERRNVWESSRPQNLRLSFARETATEPRRSIAKLLD